MLGPPPQYVIRQQPQLFHNNGGGGFALVPGGDTSALRTPLVARGLAAADADGDGDLDIVVTQNGREARIWRNDSLIRSWIRIKLVAANGCATPYGASVRAVAGDASWTRTLHSGRSYLSACEPVLTFGLADIPRLDRLEITWPSGRLQDVEKPSLNTLVTIRESVP